MKVFTKDEFYCEKYTEEFSKIMGYLTAHGNLIVAPRTVYTLYRVYSENCHRTYWKPIDEQILADFTDWLSMQDM